MNDARRFGSIGGIFHLAVIVNDKLFENQSLDHFYETFAVKAMSTKYLDELTRIQCPDLEYFVAFTSVANGRGSPGQTAYGKYSKNLRQFILHSSEWAHLRGQSRAFGHKPNTYKEVSFDLFS